MGPRFRGDDEECVGAFSPPTSTPAFISNTRAASFAARAIAGSSRTRSCAIEPVDQQRELCRKPVRIGDIKRFQEIAKPEAAAFLEGDRDLLDRLIISSAASSALTEEGCCTTRSAPTRWRGGSALRSGSPVASSRLPSR